MASSNAAMSAAPVPQEISIAGFEGLFVRALHADGELREELREAGYDMGRPEPKYPIEVWNRCIDLALKHRLPGRPRPQALRELGAIMIDGVFQTIVGSVIAVGLPMLGVERVIQRLPRYITSASFGVTMTVQKVGEREYHLRSRDAQALPEMTAGMIEAGLKRTKTQVTAEVVERDPGGYVVSIRW